MVQKARTEAMTKMLVRLMIPMSVIESDAWKDYMGYIDPSYNVPTVQTVKVSGLVPMVKKVEEDIKNLLSEMKYVNVSVDGWSDATNRCFNGYICQGIDNNWTMRTLPVAFEFVKGKHTGQAIKAQYDKVSKYLGIDKKTFKIVADQGKYCILRWRHLYIFKIIILFYSGECQECL